MKEKFNQMFKDKLFLVMLVLGLLTIVAAAGVITIQRGNSKDEQNPYMQIQEPGQSIAGETAGEETPTQMAGSANADQVEKTAEEATKPQAYAQSQADNQAEPVGAGKDTAVPLVLDFGDTSRMEWPISGNILLDYSMDSTIFFPTLEQFQTNPGLVIQGEVSSPVYAPANAKVVTVSADEEIGNYVVLDLGNDYLATCGQLKEIQVMEHEYLEEGQLLGYIAEPTKYYSVEGSNLFLKLQHGDKTVDPLDYLQ